VCRLRARSPRAVSGRHAGQRCHTCHVPQRTAARLRTLPIGAGGTWERPPWSALEFVQALHSGLSRRGPRAAERCSRIPRPRPARATCSHGTQLTTCVYLAACAALHVPRAPPGGSTADALNCGNILERAVPSLQRRATSPQRPACAVAVGSSIMQARSYWRSVESGELRTSRWCHRRPLT
jgi:hypothetical protein